MVGNFDFGTEKLPGTEYGLVRTMNDKNASDGYRRYPSNVHWDPEDARLMALEVYLYQQKLDLTTMMHSDEKTHDLLFTSRSVGDDGSSNVGAPRDSTVTRTEDTVDTFSFHRALISFSLPLIRESDPIKSIF